jgi:hypothetical protein
MAVLVMASVLPVNVMPFVACRDSDNNERPVMSLVTVMAVGEEFVKKAVELMVLGMMPLNQLAESDHDPLPDPIHDPDWVTSGKSGLLLHVAPVMVPFALPV